MRRLPGAAWVLLALAGLCVLGPPILGLDPLAPDAARRLVGPSLAHPLGTDALGRDVLARLLVGGRISLAVAFAASLVSVLVGGALGLLAGYRGGGLDALILRATELFLAVPKLPLLVVLAAIDAEALGIGPFAKLVVIMSAFSWMTAARLARAAALPLREADFVRAARGFGASTGHVLRWHLWPAARGPLLVATTLDVGELVVYENVLSFLGLGVPPPAPSWGTLLAEAFVHLERAPALVLAPGLATVVTVAAVNRLADRLRGDPEA